MASIFDRKMIYLTWTLFLLATLLGFTVAAFDASVCNPNTKPQRTGASMPVLPSTYQVRIECNMIDLNTTMGVIEYYDGPNNRGTLVETTQGIDVWAYYDYNNNELLEVIPSAGNQCEVKNLAKSRQSVIFGVKTANGKHRIFSASGALRFGGKFPEQYMGKTRVRGIFVDHWRSCIYWPSMYTTVVADYYFSDKLDWSTSSDEVSVPVRLHINGTMTAPGQPKRHIEHNYEFSQFSPVLPDPTLVFETPRGTVCPGRKSTKSLPTPAAYFSYNSEEIIVELQMLGFMKEFYDFQGNLTRYDYKALPFGVHQFGKNPVTEVHDFNTGVAYIMDNIRGNCTMQLISDSAFDATGVDPNHARMRTKQQFFDFAKASYIYEGTRTVRGILCDVWIAKRYDWPTPTSGINSTFEWYFATNNWDISAGRSTFGTPVQLIITAFGYSGGSDMHFIYNIYGYSESSFPENTFDISRCFQNTNGKTLRKYYSFSIPGNYKTLILSNERMFKYSISLNIAFLTGLSPIRVTQIQMDYSDPNNIMVTFALLQRTPFVTNPTNQDTMTLAQAAKKLKTLINNNHLRLNILSGKNVNMNKVIYATPYSFRAKINDDPNSGGYSAGSMAALAVIMLVLGLIVGAVLLYVRHVRGRSGRPKKLRENDEPLATAME